MPLNPHIIACLPSRRHSSAELAQNNNQKNVLHQMVRNTALELRYLVDQLARQEPYQTMSRQTIMNEVSSILESNAVNSPLGTVSDSTVLCSQEIKDEGRSHNFKQTEEHYPYPPSSSDYNYNFHTSQHIIPISRPSSNQEPATSVKKPPVMNGFQMQTRLQLPSVQTLLMNDINLSKNNEQWVTSDGIQLRVPTSPSDSAFGKILTDTKKSLSRCSSAPSNSLSPSTTKASPTNRNIFPNAEVEPTHIHAHASPSTKQEPKSMIAKEKCKRNQCHICGRICSRPSTLITHLSIHTGDKPYKCSWPGCDKHFNVKSNMLRHYKRHECKGTSSFPSRTEIVKATGLTI